MKECRNEGNQNRHFAPFFPKKVDTHFSRRYREDIEKIASSKVRPSPRRTYRDSFVLKSYTPTFLHNFVSEMHHFSNKIRIYLDISKNCCIFAS